MSGENPTECTEVVNVKQSDCDVYAGRGDWGSKHMMNTPVHERGWLGNPYKMEEDTLEERERVVKNFVYAFKMRLEDDAEFRQAVQELEGTRLGCYCKPKLCHAEVIASYVNGEWEL